MNPRDAPENTDEKTLIILLNIIEALRAIRANFLRTIITILIIAFGLTALIGVLTAIDGVKFWFSSSFVRIGTNTFRIENYTTGVRSGGEQKKKRQVHLPITYEEAEEFKREFSPYAPVSISAAGSFTTTAKYKSVRTQNNLQLIGGDEAFIVTDNYTIEKGRNINPDDVKLFRNVALLGHEVVNLLFNGENPIGKMVQLNGKAYQVIGTLAEVGSQGLVGGDKISVIPITTLSQDAPRSRRSFGLHVLSENIEDMENLTFEAVGEFRRIRGLKPAEENNFGIIKVDAIINNLMDNLRYLTWSATVIAIITLFSAAIGLMNIMLVSVTERTREIGVRKALGARKGTILLQFLTEAVVITQLGGLLGIGFGVLVGNIVSLLLGTGFVVPWDWVFFGFFLCLLVGVIAGIYPARKAAALDPIESLRYE